MPNPFRPGLAPERRPVDRVALHQLAHVEVAQQLVPPVRELGVPVDVEHGRRRRGHDHPLRPHPAAAGVHDGVAVALGDPVHRRGQRDDVAELLRQPQRDQLRAADEAALLRAVHGVGVAGEGADVALVARARDVPEHVEERQLARVGAEAGLGPAADQVLDAVGVDGVAADPLAERHRVPLGGARVRPRGVDRDLGGVLVDPGQQQGGVREDQRVRRDGALVLQPPGRRGDVDAVAVDVLVERADVELLGQPQDVVLGGPDERAAGLDRRALVEVVVEHPAADPLAGLDQQHRPPALRDLARGDQARRCRRRPRPRRPSRAASPGGSRRSPRRSGRRPRARPATGRLRPAACGARGAGRSYGLNGRGLRRLGAGLPSEP